MLNNHRDLSGFFVAPIALAPLLLSIGACTGIGGTGYPL